MSDNQYLNVDSESASVLSHLTIIQGVIQRMAANSSACKAWCVTLVAAVLVIVADKGKPDYAWIALLPTFIFCMLDGYYLAMEKAFRDTYNDFVKKVHAGQV